MNKSRTAWPATVPVLIVMSAHILFFLDDSPALDTGFAATGKWNSPMLMISRHGQRPRLVSVVVPLMLPVHSMGLILHFLSSVMRDSELSLQQIFVPVNLHFALDLIGKL